MPRKLSDSEKRLISLTYKRQFDKVFNEILLTDRQRQVFILYYNRGMTMLEISYELSINIKAVASDINEIARKLADYDFTDI